MKCMICKQDISEDNIICPNCGAMPWKMPDIFLNPEQHKTWLTEFYEPQLMRWTQTVKLKNRVDLLLKENAQLKQELHNLKSKNVSISSPNPPASFGLTLTSDVFVIRNGNLIKCDPTATIANIPNGVVHISKSCFAECKSLSKVIIPASVKTIGLWAFSYCKKLSDVIIIEKESVESIGDCSFYGCTSLKQITLPQSLNNIGASAFADCKSLTEITIPLKVTRIGRVAFGGCTNLRVAKVPRKLSVPDNCFPKKCRIIRY